MTQVETLDLERTGHARVSGSGRIDFELALPPNSQGVVLIVDGGGSCRLSPRNRYVAKLLRERGFGTLLVDTLTPEEHALAACPAHAAHDKQESAKRILLSTKWFHEVAEVSGLPLGILASGAGTCGALLAAADSPNLVQAVVIRGSVPEPACDVVPVLKAPVLVILGSHDTASLQTTGQLLDRIASSHKRLEVMPGASEPFDEPGTLTAASLHAANWFKQFLVRHDRAVVQTSRLSPREPSPLGDQ